MWIHINVTGSVLSSMTADLVFHHEHKAILIHYQISLSKSPRIEWSVLLAAFPKHSGKLYEFPGTLMELWGWLYVAVCVCATPWY